MLIGILETGRPPPDLDRPYPDYPEVFESLLSAAAPQWRYQSFAALDGELPNSPTQCDAWVITGSRFGAYDPDLWISELQIFVQHVYAAGIPIAGICFGHQLLAQALGGRVVKSSRGWGVGVHEYQLDNAPEWMNKDASSFSIHAFHQDQIVELPSEASVIATSEFCPNAALVYGDKAISFQGHPEMNHDFSSALLESRRGTLIPDSVVDAALATMQQPLDQSLVARWMVQFIRHAHERVALIA